MYRDLFDSANYDDDDNEVGTTVSILPQGTVIPEGLQLTLPYSRQDSDYRLRPTKSFTVSAFNELVQSMCGALETVSYADFQADTTRFPIVDNNYFY